MKIDYMNNKIVLMFIVNMKVRILMIYMNYRSN